MMASPNFDFNVYAIGASAHPAVCWSPANDHRWSADTGRGLFYVADAFGPTYGGYYAPFGVDPGLAALVATFDQGETPGCSRLGRALATAHEEMRRLAREYIRAFEERLGGGEQDRLKAALNAADAVRPQQWKRLAGQSHAHFGASVTACCLHGRSSVAVAQVGECRAYLCRGGKLDVLIRDHTLGTILAAGGKPDDNPEFHALVNTRWLGVVDELQVDERVLPVQEGDILFLCSSSIWRACGDLFTDFCRPGRGAAEAEKFVADCAARSKHDATILIVAFGTTSSHPASGYRSTP